MRRLVLALTLILTTFLLWGVVASPIPAHAATQTISVNPNPVATGNTATVNGTGFTANNWAYVYWQRPDGTTNAVWVSTDSTGAFAFTLGFLASHGTGTEWITAYDNGMGTWTNWVPITVTAGTTTTAEQLSANPNPVTLPSPTESFTAHTTVTGTYFTPNNWVWVQWTRPDGTMNGGWIFTDNNGSFSFTLDFDPAHHCGNETLQAFDNGTGTWSAPYVIRVNCGM